MSDVDNMTKLYLSKKKLNLTKGHLYKIITYPVVILDLHLFCFHLLNSFWVGIFMVFTWLVSVQAQPDSISVIKNYRRGLNFWQDLKKYHEYNAPWQLTQVRLRFQRFISSWKISLRSPLWQDDPLLRVQSIDICSASLVAIYLFLVLFHYLPL